MKLLSLAAVGMQKPSSDRGTASVKKTDDRNFSEVLFKSFGRWMMESRTENTEKTEKSVNKTSSKDSDTDLGRMVEIFQISGGIRFQNENHFSSSLCKKHDSGIKSAAKHELNEKNIRSESDLPEEKSTSTEKGNQIQSVLHRGSAVTEKKKDLKKNSETDEISTDSKEKKSEFTSFEKETTETSTQTVVIRTDKENITENEETEEHREKNVVFSFSDSNKCAEKRENESENVKKEVFISGSEESEPSVTFRNNMEKTWFEQKKDVKPEDRVIDFLYIVPETKEEIRRINPDKNEKSAKETIMKKTESSEKVTEKNNSSVKDRESFVFEKNSVSETGNPGFSSQISRHSETGCKEIQNEKRTENSVKTVISEAVETGKTAVLKSDSFDKAVIDTEKKFTIEKEFLTVKENMIPSEKTVFSHSDMQNSDFSKKKDRSFLENQKDVINFSFADSPEIRESTTEKKSAAVTENRTSENNQKAWDSMLKELNVKISRGDKEIRMTIDPGNGKGEIEVSARISEGKLEIRFSTEDSQMREWISRNASEFRSEMKKNELDVSRFDVNEERNSQGNGKQQGGRNREEQKNRKERGTKNE